MSFVDNSADNSIEKHELVVIKPRARVTGWTLYEGTTTWVADFDFGVLSRMWRRYNDSDGEPVLDEYDHGGDGIFQDLEAGKLYYFGGTVNPDDAIQAAIDGTVPGLTVEFELYLSTDTFTGPSDPTDQDSPVVDWIPCIEKAPRTAMGSRTGLYGFTPVEESAIVLLNQDGRFSEMLYACTFKFAEIRAFVMADFDMDRAAELGNVQEVFRGYGGTMKLDAEGFITIGCDNLFAFFDALATPSQRMALSDFPGADPQSVKPGSEWFIRRVRGMVENHKPVNIDYDETPATNKNRDWLTHEGTGTDGTVGFNVDHVLTVAGTQTFFQTTPTVMPGDTIILRHSATNYYTIVDSVNYANKSITHGNIAGRVVINGDNATRYNIGWVKIKDSDGNWWNLFAGRDYTRINSSFVGAGVDWLGFQLTDNFEATISFPETFDPKKHEIQCRVYGTTVQELYPDASTESGEITNYGGTNAQATALLYWLLLEAGIPEEMIDQASFEAISTNHSLGLCIPADREATTALSFSAYIGLVLQSMLWKISLVASGAEIKLGLVETGPFVAAGDFDVSDADYRNFEFEHEYADLYNRVELIYLPREGERLEDTEQIYGPVTAPNESDAEHRVYAENRLCRDLHFVTNTFELEVLQFIQAEAQLQADRLSYAMGDRRAFYTMSVGPEFIAKSPLGASWNLSRKDLPGFAIDEDADQERQLSIIEVEKSNAGVTLTLEDQKAIQDHSGDWS